MELLFVFIITNLFFVFYAIVHGMKEAFCKNYDESSKRVLDFSVKKLFNLKLVFVFMMISSLIGLINLWYLPFVIGQLFIFTYIQRMFFNFTYKKIKSSYNIEDIDIKKKLSLIFGVIIEITFYLILI